MQGVDGIAVPGHDPLERRLLVDLAVAGHHIAHAEKGQPLRVERLEPGHVDRLECTVPGRHVARPQQVIAIAERLLIGGGDRNALERQCPLHEAVAGGEECIVPLVDDGLDRARGFPAVGRLGGGDADLTAVGAEPALHFQDQVLLHGPEERHVAVC